MANRLFQYVRESRDELKKVVWPTRQETVRHTIMVIAISVAVAVFLGALDYVFAIGLDVILK